MVLFEAVFVRKLYTCPIVEVTVAAVFKIVAPVRGILLSTTSSHWSGVVKVVVVVVVKGCHKQRH